MQQIAHILRTQNFYFFIFFNSYLGVKSIQIFYELKVLDDGGQG